MALEREAPRLGDQARHGPRPPEGTYRATPDDWASGEPGTRAGAVLQPHRTDVPPQAVLVSGGGLPTVDR
jgi:hypothetical protein